jgi:hypothetical protein
MKSIFAFALIFFFSGQLLAQNEISFPQKYQKPLTLRNAFVADINMLSLIPVTGDPSLGLRAGIFIPKYNLTLTVGANTPVMLNDLSANSLFREGDRFDLFWRGEVSLNVRYHFRKGSQSGFYAVAGIGYEEFELTEKGQPDAPMTVVENGFLPVGFGYTAFLWGTKLYTSLGVNAVFLFGSQGDVLVGEQVTEQNWGFVTPELRIGFML